MSLNSTAPPADLMLRLDSEEGDCVLDLAAIFDNDYPVEVEIGIGKGRFILDASQANANINYIGVDVAGKYLRLARDRAVRRQLENVRFVHGDAGEFVEFFLAAASIQAVHVYFPDPWPKKRHHKRRVICHEFLAEVLRVLVPAGRLWLKTDHADYFAAMLEFLQPFASHFEPIEATWIGVRTNFEEKYVNAGRSIYRQVLEKV